MKEKKVLVKILSAVIAFAMMIAMIPALPANAAETITLNGITADVIDARGMLDLVNEWRATDPKYKGSASSTVNDTQSGHTTALIYDYGLEEIALQRAIEVSCSFSHTRPDGTSYSTVTDSQGNTSSGENIAAGTTTIEAAFEAWKEEDEDYAGQGHRRNMLGVLGSFGDWTHIGIAGIKRNGITYWAMEFRQSASSTTPTTLPDSKTISIDVKVDDISAVTLNSTENPISVKTGETTAVDYSTLSASINLTEGWPESSSSLPVSDLSILTFGLYTTSDSSTPWSDTDSTKATLVQNNSGNQLTITGNAEGTTYLRAHIADGSDDVKFYSAAITVNVDPPKTVSSIALNTAPTNNTYTVGGTLDVTGGKITVTYSDSTTADIDMTSDMISGFDTSSAGKKTATVTYSGQTVTFPYLVIDEPSAVTATYGQTLADLTVPTSSYGTFAWQDASSTSVGSAGSRTFNVKFTPADSSYSALSDIPVTVTVNKANPTVTDPISITATYGQTLNDAASQLPSSSAGTYAFEQALTTSVGNAGTDTTSFTAKYTPNDTGNFNILTGIKVNMTVNKADITPAVTISDIEYGGTLSPSVTGNPGGGTVTYKYYDADGNPLSSTPAEVGTYQVEAVVAATSNYNGATTEKTEFNITQKNVSLTVNDISDQVYTGSAIEPDVTFTTSPSVSLTKGTDYTVSYADNTAVGQASATVKPIATSNYTFTQVTKNFTISRATITNANLSLPQTKYQYTGSAITPEPKVVVNGKTLTKDTDYTVSYADNTDVGQATVTVSGTGSYQGNAAVNFDIVTKTALTISGIEDQSHEYTGSAVVLDGTLTVTGGPITPEQLTETWYDSSDNELTSAPVNAGTYKVVYSYEDDNYAGSKTVNVEITKKKSEVPTVEAKKVKAGTTLSDITLPENAAWVDPTAEVSAGSHKYQATFTEKGDTANYTTETFEVTVYGLSKINISTSVSGGTDGHGTVTPSMTDVLEGTKVTIEFTPDAGYVIDKVLVGSVETSVTDNKLEVTAGTSDINIEVTYKFHEHQMTHYSATTATCTEDGHAEYWECSVCGKKFSDEAGSTELTDDEIVIPALGHDLLSSEWTSDATGHWHKCRNCDEKVDFAGHDYGAWVHTGSHTHGCEVCGYEETEECTFGEWQITKQPTATVKGEKERLCTKCGYVEKAAVATTGETSTATGETSTATDTPTGSGEKPATGDNNTILWLFFALLASAGALLTSRKLKKDIK